MPTFCQLNFFPFVCVIHQRITVKRMMGPGQCVIFHMEVMHIFPNIPFPSANACKFGKLVNIYIVFSV